MHHAHIDKYAYGDSVIHRLDARVKLIMTLVFTGLIVSLPKTQLSILFCYAVGPFLMLVMAGIPLRFVCKHTLSVSPFILVLALTCPFFDRTPVEVSFGPFVGTWTAGWLRCFTILGKFMVSLGALIALISTTRFSDLLAALQRLKVPQVLVMQLGFLYRYIFLLIDTAHHMLRARSSRRLRRLGFRLELKVITAMLGTLLLKSLDTAQQVTHAMQARGFTGQWHYSTQQAFQARDILFIGLGAGYMLVIYILMLPNML
jgi:cobalt/nickel transport system permease protein